MACVIRRWRVSDQERLAEMLSNPKVLDNLRDGLPYPYTPADGETYIRSMLAAERSFINAWISSIGTSSSRSSRIVSKMAL